MVRHIQKPSFTFVKEKNNMIKTIIAYEDDAALRRQFDNIFVAIRQNYRLEGSFADAQDVLHHIEKYQPAGVLMDIQMLEDDDGLVALYQIKRHTPSVKVMMLTMFDNDDKVFNALCLGADGYMLKSEFSSAQMPHEAIRKSLNVIFEGGAYLTPAVAKKILTLISDETIAEKVKKVKNRFQQIITNLTHAKKIDMPYKLTKTQILVLQKIVEGQTTAEIANELDVTENTVNTHIKAIYSELEVHSRAKAIRKAIEERIVEIKM
jgi:DNA-binding NarL/FixJ family response regulator